ncbi:ETC complex I subunit [Govanella unica]|uniref:ETC complex I subunit n=1 Tax=Govanella unica TaxID=2975056 RepID=A0A9X3Z739_9PROT|nr:ETC complex I subunit [Govania unica]MDA5193668.1 ETC complex I subunit [Govania unica]
MVARIYQPAKNTMQSGRGNSRQWVLEFEPEGGKSVDPLMGWTSSADTRGQIQLKFDTEAEAVDYASRNNLTFQVIPPHERVLKIRAYAENFR